MNNLILAIETSCDETAVAVSSGTKILSNAIHSQLDLHKKYGGVVPSVARLAHQEKFDDVLQEALSDAHISLSDISAVAVTQGPGLAIALEVGIAKAKELAQKLQAPLIPVNHMEGHLWSWAAAEDTSSVHYPVLGLLVSGKHSEFILVEGFGKYTKLGQTLDDAAGEAYDKVANMLGLGYPGGPVISKLAQQGRESGELDIHISKEQDKVYVVERNSGVRLPIAMANSGDLNLSYSGLKTAVKRLVNDWSGTSSKLNIRETMEEGSLSQEQVLLLATVFEEAALSILKLKLEQALRTYPDVHEVWLGGGVSANKYLQELLIDIAKERKLTIRMPASGKLMTDNAAMVGIVAGLKLASGASFEEIDRVPNLSL